MKISLLKLASLCLFALPLSAVAEKKHPDCMGVDDWPAVMVLGYAKDKATDPQSVEQVVDYKKLKVERLASVKAGTDKTLSKKYDPTKYRQIHHITYYKKSGEVLIDAITDGIAYQFECSGGELKIYEISNTFPK